MVGSGTVPMDTLLKVSPLAFTTVTLVSAAAPTMVLMPGVEHISILVICNGDDDVGVIRPGHLRGVDAGPHLRLKLREIPEHVGVDVAKVWRHPCGQFSQVLDCFQGQTGGIILRCSGSGYKAFCDKILFHDDMWVSSLHEKTPDEPLLYQ